MKPNRAPHKHNTLNKKILAQGQCPVGNITQRGSLGSSTGKKIKSILQPYLRTCYKRRL